MGLKVFTNTNVRKPWFCGPSNYMYAAHPEAGVGVPLAMAAAPANAMRTSGKGTRFCYRSCSEQRYLNKSWSCELKLGSSTELRGSQISASEICCRVV